MEQELIQQVQDVVSNPTIDYTEQIIMLVDWIKSIFILLSIYCGLDIGMKVGKK